MWWESTILSLKGFASFLCVFCLLRHTKHEHSSKERNFCFTHAITILFFYILRMWCESKKFVYITFRCSVTRRSYGVVKLTERERVKTSRWTKLVWKRHEHRNFAFESSPNPHEFFFGFTSKLYNVVVARSNCRSSRRTWLDLRYFPACLGTTFTQHRLCIKIRPIRLTESSPYPGFQHNLARLKIQSSALPYCFSLPIYIIVLCPEYLRLSTTVSCIYL